MLSKPIIKIGSKWQRTAINYIMDTAKVQRLTNQRLLEWQVVQKYINSKECLMLFLQGELDDNNQRSGYGVMTYRKNRVYEGNWFND